MIFFLNYLCDIVGGDGKKVYFVSKAFGGLHCGNVRVDENSLDVLFFERFNCLKEIRKRKKNTINQKDGYSFCSAFIHRYMDVSITKKCKRLT